MKMQRSTVAKSFLAKHFSAATSGCIVGGLVLGTVMVASGHAAVALVAGLIVTLAVHRHPLRALAILIFLTPFSETTILSRYIMNVPGAKPLNLLAVVVLAIAVLNHRQAGKMPRLGIVFASVSLFLFVMSVFRSVAELDLINTLRPESLSLGRYLLSDLVKPLIYFLPFFIVTKYVGNAEQLEGVFLTIVVTLFCLSLCVLYNYSFGMEGEISIDMAETKYETVFSLHRNDLATFYILGFPITLAYFFTKRNYLAGMMTVIVLLAVAFLYSRTAYLTTIFSFLAYMVISKRGRLLPIALAVGIGLLSAIAPTVVERASTGIASRDVDVISAGRVDTIWTPVFKEYWHNPEKFMFGSGRYGILVSDAMREGKVLEGILHPHNMYLEQLLDSGLVGLLMVLTLHGIIVIRFIGSMRSRDKRIEEYQYAILISIACFYFAGITGRSLFPSIDNSFFWIILGTALVMMDSREDMQTRDCVEGQTPSIHAKTLRKRDSTRR